MKAALPFLVRVLLAAFLAFAGQAQAQGTAGAHNVRQLMALDVDYYRQAYPDMLYLTNSQINTHWLRHGIKEGRQSSPSFAVRDYLYRYPDLLERFGPAGFERALNHFIREGRAQGRDARPEVVVRAEQEARLAQQRQQAKPQTPAAR